ncbi:MAG: MFS transporter, partial [Verrucomicrobiota bacterium]
VLRYVLFAFGDPEGLIWMYYLGILLHGICYDFFFVTGQIYVDKAAGEKIRASAQGFITLITYGLGMLIGAWASGLIVKSFETANPTGEILREWSSIWLVPAGMALVVIILFAILFKHRETSPAA